MPSPINTLKKVITTFVLENEDLKNQLKILKDEKRLDGERLINILKLEQDEMNIFDNCKKIINEVSSVSQTQLDEILSRFEEEIKCENCIHNKGINYGKICRADRILMNGTRLGIEFCCDFKTKKVYK